MQAATPSESNYDEERSLQYIYENNPGIKSEDLDELDLSAGKIDRVVTSPAYSASDLDADDPEWEEFKPVRVRKSPKSPRRTSGRRKNGRKVAARGRHIIQHNYHDHSSDPIENDNFIQVQDSACAIKKKGGVTIPFPLKLHELLEKAEAEGLTHIVSWQPHGRAFVVHEPKLFVKQLMHKFFRQTKLTSFQRQLNLYGFCRLTKGRDSGGYYHELFLRGRPHLTKRMVRTKIKGTGYKAASNPDCEPDFYNMSVVGINNSTASPTSIVKRNSLPMVTLDTSFEFDSGKFDAQLQVMNGAPQLENLPRIDGLVTNKHVHKPYLNPRVNPKVVRMGNQSFQYMEPLHPVNEPGSIVQPYPSKPDGEEQESISISPSIFENTFSEENFQDGSCEDMLKRIDPLSVFLSEIGTDFEDDINFGSVGKVSEKNLHMV